MFRRTLTPRMLKALKILRYECDFEDHHKGGTNNFISRNELSPGIGEKTIAQLLELGLIETGPNRWRDEIGFRITGSGRDFAK